MFVQSGFTLTAGVKCITKDYKAPFSFNFQPCPMSPPQDVMPYPRLQGSHYPRQWWPGNWLPLPCNYPPWRQRPGSHYPWQWWPGNRLPLSGSHPPWLQWPGSHYPRQWWPGNRIPFPGSHHSLAARLYLPLSRGCRQRIPFRE
jgi:hypothetical protein